METKEWCDIHEADTPHRQGCIPCQEDSRADEFRKRRKESLRYLAEKAAGILEERDTEHQAHRKSPDFALRALAIWGQLQRSLEEASIEGLRAQWKPAWDEEAESWAKLYLDYFEPAAWLRARERLIEAMDQLGPGEDFEAIQHDALFLFCQLDEMELAHWSLRSLKLDEDDQREWDTMNEQLADCRTAVELDPSVFSTVFRYAQMLESGFREDLAGEPELWETTAKFDAVLQWSGGLPQTP